ncbi:MAG: U32 family peptidase [Candidatus Pacebacteria bacterium]|nr:U32 family peptidase [Candidatus Paceibacterota bacterium]
MKIELLSPAKNLESGIIAINSGADAIYIGAYKFGARINAGNSLNDIKELALYAHKFGAKVYVVLNTILYDDELDEVQNIIDELKEIKVDALIIQDVGILELNLHDIPVIASTQMDNFDIDKIKFLEKIGFKRVILRRELSLKQIEEIKKNTNIELEAFIHGALCVSLSGRCYLSQYLGSKSGNRGECMQPCRLPYSLIDSAGKILIKDKYLLSLKDFNLSNHLEDLINAGITSFKIEGRLKDIDYVSNVTYYYRRKIDEILKRRKDLERSSFGDIFSKFEGDLERTFNRSFTDYFIKERQKDILAINSPKSIGKFIGKIKTRTKDYFTLDRKHDLSLGDGLCFFNENGDLKGSNVIKIDKDKVFLNDVYGFSIGDEVYINFDIKFDRVFKQKDFIQRKIGLSFALKEVQNGIYVSIKDDAKHEVSEEFKVEKEYAKDKGLAIKNIENQFSKLGNTIFYLKNIKIDFYNRPLFIRLSILNKIRRDIVKRFEDKIIQDYENEKSALDKNNRGEFYLKKLSYEFNVSNKLAESFYKKHGVLEIEPAFEIKEGDKLMTTKHCLKYYLGFCKKQGLKEPLYLINERGQKFLLEFNCKECQMEIYKNPS